MNNNFCLTGSTNLPNAVLEQLFDLSFIPKIIGPQISLVPNYVSRPCYFELDRILPIAAKCKFTKAFSVSCMSRRWAG